ncbi:uncharacterized protein Aud_005272 [Aspergillus udagawae]|uniref:Uncharacterized protein n=1 Tax=Aspergillus udagawae TaxID=91492 RepID=A0A8E0UZX7_9EURO|nr:uncharacterized protein Aud_005272 [Aspergillus udagawae]GIC88871.1 hypothetical protein Aud_005272 [Aspergillus udagawae]
MVSSELSESSATRSKPGQDIRLSSGIQNATFSPIQFIAARGITSERGGTIPDIDFDTQWEAIECFFGPVVQSVRARVEDNIYDEDLLASWADLLDAQE